jgi:hypothetical protein
VEEGVTCCILLCAAVLQEELQDWKSWKRKKLSAFIYLFKYSFFHIPQYRVILKNTEKLYHLIYIPLFILNALKWKIYWTILLSSLNSLHTVNLLSLSKFTGE